MLSHWFTVQCILLFYDFSLWVCGLEGVGKCLSQQSKETLLINIGNAAMLIWALPFRLSQMHLTPIHSSTLVYSRLPEPYESNAPISWYVLEWEGPVYSRLLEPYQSNAPTRWRVGMRGPCLQFVRGCRRCQFCLRETQLGCIIHARSPLGGLWWGVFLEVDWLIKP